MEIDATREAAQGTPTGHGRDIMGTQRVAREVSTRETPGRRTVKARVGPPDATHLRASRDGSYLVAACGTRVGMHWPSYVPERVVGDLALVTCPRCKAVVKAATASP